MRIERNRAVRSCCSSRTGVWELLVEPVAHVLTVANATRKAVQAVQGPFGPKPQQQSKRNEHSGALPDLQTHRSSKIWPRTSQTARSAEPPPPALARSGQDRHQLSDQTASVVDDSDEASVSGLVLVSVSARYHKRRSQQPCMSQRDTIDSPA
jgi:hypothetical protein